MKSILAVSRFGVTDAHVASRLRQHLHDVIGEADGFIVEDSNGRRPGTSPVKFLQALMSTIRRNGRAISKTDMGDILEGKLLDRSHFESRSVGTA